MHDQRNEPREEADRSSQAEPSPYKTTVDDSFVHDFVRERYPDISAIEKIAGGEGSQAFELLSLDTSTILRFGRKIDNFRKDQAAWTRFGNALPIPRVIEVGQVEGDLAYALSEKAEGKRIDKHSRTEVRALIPAELKMLSIIHRQALPANACYGSWTADSEPTFSSWRECLESEIAAREGGIVCSTEDEKKHIQKLRDSFASASDLAEVPPRLLHGDFGFDNAFASADIISAVIDWEGAMYGDPTYDLAWKKFWHAHIYQEDLDVLSIYLANGGIPEHLGQQPERRLQMNLDYLGLREFCNAYMMKRPEFIQKMVDSGPVGL